MNFKNLRADVPVYKNAAALPSNASNGQAASTEDGLFFVFNGSLWVEKASGGGGTWGSIAGTLSNQTDLQNALDAKQDVIVANNEQFIYQNGSGDIIGLPGWERSAESGGALITLEVNPNNNVGSFDFHRNNLTVNPIANSPNDSREVNQVQVGIDTDSDGFSLGTNGTALRFNIYNASHLGTSDIGSIEFTQNNFNLGNGTDAIDVKGVGYQFGFGQINANVNVSGPIQGYGFQPNVDAAATIANSTFSQAFYDAANIECASANYNSFNAAPVIESIQNNANYNGVVCSPTINTFTGNSSFGGFSLSPTLGTFATGSFTGVSVNPSITSVLNATGIYINMAGVTGTNVKAMDITGDVSINGSLTFSGALSIGQLQAFYSSNPIDGGGNPQNMHGLTTEMVALNGVTTANGDAIGVNTAMLITLEDNSITTSGAFELGFTALALPCVVETHTGASLDFMSGTTAAINLSGSSTGGTIEELRVSRGVVVPNGITTINRSMGFFYHEPFGGVATDSWGIYIADAQKNYLESPLKVGGTETPDSGFILHAEGATKLEGDLAQLTGNVGFYGTTPVAQPASSGPATAGGTYTATEQAMLQEVYNAVRALGLMS